MTKLCFFAAFLALTAALLPPAGRADLPALTVLHTFASGGQDDLIPAHHANSDGASPEAALTQGRDGALYGTTTSGGAHGTGVVFKITPEGVGFTVLHSFGPLGTLFVNDTNTDGARPTAALVCGKDGALYGVAAQGGPSGSGTVFRLNSDGTGFAVLHGFEAKEELYHNRGGASPNGLTLGPDGLLYGTAALGGSGRGLIFRLTPDGKNFTVLHSFPDVDYDGNGNTGGAIPSAAVVFGPAGMLYGTANIGGRHGSGVLYALTADGKRFTVLHEFQRKVKNNGVFPNGPLVFGPDGLLYGAARQGGADDGGIVYKIKTDGGGFAVLHAFSDPYHKSDDGWGPSALSFNKDGRLYGLSVGAGDEGSTLLFEISTDGAKFFLLHGFQPQENGGNAVGMTLGSDGRLYGVSTNGGANGSGTIFRVTFPAARTH